MAKPAGGGANVVQRCASSTLVDGLWPAYAGAVIDAAGTGADTDVVRIAVEHISARVHALVAEVQKHGLSMHCHSRLRDRHRW